MMKLGKRQNQKERPPLSLNSLRTQAGYIPRALRLVWDAVRGWTLASTALLVVQGLLPVLTVYLTREVVNALVVVVGNGTQNAAFTSLLISGGLLAVVLVADAVLGGVQSHIRTVMSEHIQDHLTNLIHTKTASLDVQYYEDPTFYDQLQRAGTDAITQPLVLLENLNSLLQSTITLIAMGSVLLTYTWWLPLALVIGTLPALWVAIRTTRLFHDWRIRNTTNQRRLLYYNRILLNDQAVAEVRLFDLGNHFRLAYLQLRRKLRGERLQLSLSQLLAQTMAAVLGLLSLGLALAWMGWQAVQGLFSLGDLALFWQVLNQGQRLMQNLLSGVGNIYRNLFFLEDLFTFLDLTPRLEETAAPQRPAPGLNQGIEVRDITFQYPGSPVAALSGFNLTIPAGKIVAIVGENGAGKSTLLKLLCRFYDPLQGSITWDGTDLRQMAQVELRRRITVLFQQPMPYHETAADNIRLGDLASQPDQARVEQAARAGGAESIIKKLPQGYETMLGKWFGYTELSVGEWQRMALARAFVRQADLVILDEPTSAMDSWAENEWMGHFRELVHGRTALIITHRFTTAMQADIIHVMANGHLVESGTHAELVASGGRYAASWREQMREAAG